MERKRDEIIKALECVSGAFVKCKECIYYHERRLFPECRELAAKSALALIKELAEENERSKSVEFTCGFIKPHKVLECPIFDEIARTKTDTLQEIKTRFTMRYGTYTDKDMTPITEVFRLLDQIAKDMLEGL